MDWIVANHIEILGALLGLLFLYFEIKESVLLWPTGIATSVFYIFIFFQAKFYADMGLQFYYVFVSVYGWYFWIKGKQKNDEVLKISRVTGQQILWLTVICAAIYYPLGFALDNYTDSPVPYWDALTTAMSITATWMLARKILEQWLVWIVVDAISVVLYIEKELYPTAMLFIFYTGLAIIGFLQWKKSREYQNRTLLDGIV